MIAQERHSAVEMGAPPRRRWHHRPRRPIIHYFPSPVRETFLEPYPVIFGMSVEEEVASHVRINDCVVLARGGSSTGVRPAVISALKARGWVERVDVRPSGSLNVKTLLLCPPPAEATRMSSAQRLSVQPDLMVREDVDHFSTDYKGEIQGLQPSVMIIGASRRLNGIGRIDGARLAAPPTSVRVLVVDKSGQPFPGVKVTVSGNGSQSVGTTDEKGSYQIPVSYSRGVVSVDLPEGTMSQSFNVVPIGTTQVTARSESQAPGPILTTVEGVAAVGGLALTLFGVFLKKVDGIMGDVLLATGTSVIAASAFSAVSRKF